MKLRMLLLGLSLAAFSSGCITAGYSSSRWQEQYQLWQELVAHPDLPEWQEQRGKVVQSVGDRVFDKSFDEVFNAVVSGIGTLEVTVENMERGSGYIVARGNPLSTARKEALKQERLRAYCVAKGYDPELVENRKGDFWNVESMASVVNQNQPSLTFSIARQNTSRTKVKLRIAQIWYPPSVEEVYQVAWRAVDKQIFLDQHLD